MNTPCCAATSRSRRLHVGLAVKDVERATAFYEALLGAKPAKVRPGYAKFELDDPALVLSLVPKDCCGGERADHFGLRLSSTDDLAGAERDLASRGLTGEREETVCCHARQRKVWVKDPDGNPWEVYTVLEDGD
jgi:catechol 2,3-dioxygenase-like lactoylglutathione lyase family enzyme